MPSPCHPRGTLTEVAISTLIKELISRFETRRRKRRKPCTCQACPATQPENEKVTP